MRIIYGRGLLVDIGCADAGDFGFDTMQLENMYSDTPNSKIGQALQPPDDHFDPNLDFVLSLNLQGDSRCGSNSDSGARGSVDRDPWYDNPNHAFYTGWRDLLNYAKSTYGSRFKGLRWNHEYQPRIFREGSKWAAYANDHAQSDYDAVQSTYQTEWGNYLDGVGKTSPLSAYNGTGPAVDHPYTTPPYDYVRRLYRHFVDFQCKAEARMVDILAGKLGTSHPLIIYPAHREDSHVGTGAEYTIRTNQVTASNAVREIATWDLEGYDNTLRNRLAADQGNRKYFFVIQQGSKDIEDSPAANRINARINRIQSSVENCLDPGGSARDPWQNSFAFWNEWRSDDREDDGDDWITVEEQNSYMDEVALALT